MRPECDMIDSQRELTRRLFVGTAAGATVLGPANLEVDAAPEASKVIKGKHPRLRVHTTEPLVFETPVELLASHVVTPKEILFVRNNQQLEKTVTLDPLPLKDWKIELRGLIDKKTTIDAGGLAKMQHVEHEMVLQCSGNRRSFFSRAAETSGTQWGPGAIGNVRFSGVLLATVLRHHKIKISPEARFVTAEGRDHPYPKKVDFEHSIPLDDVLEKSILAVSLNGEPIPAIHGGPVRLVTPGYYATMNVKWLSRLRFEKAETTNYNHVPRYRTPNKPIKPGTKFEATLQNSTPTWKMKIASMILLPAQNAKVAGGRVEVRGVAFNDGAAAITSVIVSFDNGKTWREAKRMQRKSNYAWQPWSVSAKLRPGKHVILSRATDALGRSQPMDGAIFWNPRGYEWNGVDKVKIEAG